MPQLAELVANAPYELDLRLKGVQDDYNADMVRRFKWLAKEIRAKVIDENFLGAIAHEVATNAQVANAQKMRTNAYDYPNAVGKVPLFMKWLVEAEDAGILEVIGYEGRSVVAHSGWQNVYIKRSYSKGTEWAERKMKKLGLLDAVPGRIEPSAIGAIMSAPVHADALGIMYTRAFDQLKGITATMNQQISRVLVDGMVAGKGPRAIAYDIVNRVDKIGIARARTLARTETAFAQSEASLNRYTDFRVATVSFIFGGGPCRQNVCPPLDGQAFKTAEAHGMIPLHPNCTCAWAPVVGENELRETALPGGPRERVRDRSLVEKEAAYKRSLTRKTSIQKAEEGIRRAPLENALLFDDEGRVIMRAAGKADSISFTSAQQAKMKGRILTHNHPVGNSSFSPNDVVFMVENQIKEMRVVTRSTTYTMRVRQEGIPFKNRTMTPLEQGRTVQRIIQREQGILQTSYLEKVRAGQLNWETANELMWDDLAKMAASKLNMQYKAVPL